MKIFKVVLINCPMWDIEFPPYNIALLASVLKSNGLQVDCLDLNRNLHANSFAESDKWALPDLYAFWQSRDKMINLISGNRGYIKRFIDNLEAYDIIGFTLQSLNFTFSIELSRLIKKQFPQKIIIAGGPECFPNFNPGYLMESGCFDGICYSEGERSFPQLINRMQNGEEWDTPGFFLKIRNEYRDCGKRELIDDLDNLPFADFDFVGKEAENLCISTSRGCINRCSFCHEKNHWEKFRMRSAVSIVSELSMLKKKFPRLHFVYLNDSLINGDMEELDNFCNLMISRNLGINWGGHTLIRKEMTGGFLNKMKQAGAERLNYGLESGSDAVLGMMKKTFKRDLALEVLKHTREAGISFSVNLIVGHPGETESDFGESCTLLQRVRQFTDCVHINPCLVLKYSDLYTNHKQWGIVLPDNYVTGWYLEDGTNTLAVRLKRMQVLRNFQS